MDRRSQEDVRVVRTTTRVRANLTYRVLRSQAEARPGRDPGRRTG